MYKSNHTLAALFATLVLSTAPVHAADSTSKSPNIFSQLGSAVNDHVNSVTSYLSGNLSNKSPNAAYGTLNGNSGFGGIPLKTTAANSGVVVPIGTAGVDDCNELKTRVRDTASDVLQRMQPTGTVQEVTRYRGVPEIITAPVGANPLADIIVAGINFVLGTSISDYLSRTLQSIVNDFRTGMNRLLNTF